MRRYKGETSIKEGDKVWHVVRTNYPISYLKVGDILEGTVEAIFDGSTSGLYDEFPQQRPESFPLFHVRIHSKNGALYSDEMQCKEKSLIKKGEQNEA